MVNGSEGDVSENLQPRCKRFRSEDERPYSGRMRNTASEKTRIVDD